MCAGLLLIHPTVLSWPAVGIGVLPIAARLVMTRRPWRASLFDLPLALLVAGGLVGFAVTLDADTASVRLAGLLSAIILFAWMREHAGAPRTAHRAVLALLAVLAVVCLLMIHIAQPFLRLERLPPLRLLADAMEPLSLYQLLVADPSALQRFRWYPSGVGALAAVGLSLTAGLALTARGLWTRGLLALSGLFFVAVLVVADNRGSLLAAAMTTGVLVVLWRPRLVLVAVLLVFATLDAIAIGMVQRGLNLRTVLERLSFWQHGLALAAETPFTGVGLGVRSVEVVYRTAFEPTYPPFSHTHSIYVQSLLEQGVLGFLGLVLLVLAAIACGRTVRRASDDRLRGAGYASVAGVLALLTAGLTEIAALTTLGGALLAVLAGLLAAATDDARASQPVDARPLWRPRWLLLPLMSSLPWRMSVGLAVAASLIVLLATGWARPVAAAPFLNAGTTALYQGSSLEGASRAAREASLHTADQWLKVATAVEPANVAAWRNRALAAAASGDDEAARQFADIAAARVDPSDRTALFGVGRAYVAIQAWGPAIDTWEQAGAGPQLLRLGRQLVASSTMEEFGNGLRALTAAARLGAPGRLAQDAIVQAILDHGETVDQALGHLTPLMVDGPVGYQTRLEKVRTLRRAGLLNEAEDALAEAEQHGRDEQFELERGILLHLRGQNVEAEPVLAWAVERLRSANLPVPDGDDPRFWLATVQHQLGEHEAAVRTARAGLAELSSDQESLKAPYRLVLGESLLALGQPREALSV
ncbi:MAG: O-antigen ligase family protein, partial [Chloroflexota bacterium]